ncbi:hypothetical protein KHP62_17155 [Rhodobacteraceae bacterium NNCM2]|nr:hypothetical protein [Coraliihabitans acroporae]
MLLFRFICGILMAWALNVALARPEAAPLLEEAPDFAVMAPIAGAFVGFANLAVRQGWGVIVAVANGIWSGVLTLFVALFLYLFAVPVLRNWRVMDHFNDFMRIVSQSLGPMMEEVMNAQLLIVILAASAIVGVVTEIIHWALVHLARRKLREEE